MKELEKGAVLDAALIGAAQRVEHYEMASYGTAREFAETLGLKEVAKLLQDTLDEEGETNKKLTQIAQKEVNREAAGARTSSAKNGARRKKPSGASKLEDMTVDELYAMAKEKAIAGRSKMDKKELVKSLS